jgi:hypothetical protein
MSPAQACDQERVLGSEVREAPDPTAEDTEGPPLRQDRALIGRAQQAHRGIEADYPGCPVLLHLYAPSPRRSARGHLPAHQGRPWPPPRRVGRSPGNPTLTRLAASAKLSRRMRPTPCRRRHAGHSSDRAPTAAPSPPHPQTSTISVRCASGFASMTSDAPPPGPRVCNPLLTIERKIDAVAGDEQHQPGRWDQFGAHASSRMFRQASLVDPCLDATRRQADVRTEGRS